MVDESVTVKGSPVRSLQKFIDAEGNIPSPWSVKPWVVYEFDDADMIRGIKYVNDNLIRARLPAQEYPFIVPYQGRGGSGE